jgi:hypothetical protein
MGRVEAPVLAQTAEQGPAYLHRVGGEPAGPPVSSQEESELGAVLAIERDARSRPEVGMSVPSARQGAPLPARSRRSARAAPRPSKSGLAKRDAIVGSPQLSRLWCFRDWPFGFPIYRANRPPPLAGFSMSGLLIPTDGCGKHGRGCPCSRMSARPIRDRRKREVQRLGGGGGNRGAEDDGGGGDLRGRSAGWPDSSAARRELSSSNTDHTSASSSNMSEHGERSGSGGGMRRM